jgi:hypothetical protein
MSESEKELYLQLIDEHIRDLNVDELLRLLVEIIKLLRNNGVYIN